MCMVYVYVYAVWHVIRTQAGMAARVHACDDGAAARVTATHEHGHGGRLVFLRGSLVNIGARSIRNLYVECSPSRAPFRPNSGLFARSSFMRVFLLDFEPIAVCVRNQLAHSQRHEIPMCGSR